MHFGHILLGDVFDAADVLDQLLQLGDRAIEQFLLGDPGQVRPPIDPIKNVVNINAKDEILWNGAPVTQPQLRAYLDTTQQMNPIPELHLQPDATARYEVVDEVLAVTKRAKVQKMGFIGNEYYTQVF